MRADRLVSLVLLLRQQGRMTAEALATELEVSVRTVMRDIEALSSAGVPVYAERGRHGGFALLPGFRTELTGLNHEEALALFTADAGRGEQAFGLGAALASAMRKVVDALPADHRHNVTDAAARFLVEPETDLLSRNAPGEDIPTKVMTAVRSAVLSGHRLHIHYAAAEREPAWRTVDPVGLVTVRDRNYLLATRDGHDRTYRLSRMLVAEELAQRADRPERVDLDRIWARRCAQFLSTDHLPVHVRIRSEHREQLVDTARAVRCEEEDDDEGWLALEVVFDDLRHATWAMWQLGADAEVTSPPELRSTLRDRAAALARQYA